MIARAACAAAVMLMAWVADAHHSINGQFDLNRMVTVKGTIARVDWINPHAYVYVDVRDGAGRVTRWAISTPPIAMLRKAGITKQALAGTAGEVVTVTGHPALNGKPMAWLSRITYSDGHFLGLGE